MGCKYFEFNGSHGFLCGPIKMLMLGGNLQTSIKI